MEIVQVKVVLCILLFVSAVFPAKHFWSTILYACSKWKKSAFTPVTFKQ